MEVYRYWENQAPQPEGGVPRLRLGRLDFATCMRH